MKKLWQALILVRRCDPRSFRLRILYVVLQSLLPLLNLYILKLLVDAVTAAVTNPATAADPSPLAHFWSLSIEEQFYIIAPAVESTFRDRICFVIIHGRPRPLIIYSGTGDWSACDCVYKPDVTLKKIRC